MVAEDRKRLNQFTEENNPIIKEIVFTGGPCGGKSTILSEAKRSLEEKGYKVLALSEVATEVILSGAKPWELSPYIFQGTILDIMLTIRNRMLTIAEEYRKSGQNVVIFYDRGLLDNKAYCDSQTWNTLLQERGLSDEILRRMYDGAINIVSTACGAEEVFEEQRKNNPARSETLEEAQKKEETTERAWTGHHNFYIVGNGAGWKRKTRRNI